VTILIPALTLFIMIAALITAITADEGSVRFLPKIVWIILIVLLPLVGSIVWFAVGKDWGFARAEPVSFGDPRRHDVVQTRSAASTPEDDEAAIEAEIQFHEKQAEIRRLEAELARKRQGQG
jgi:hypothetical protein